ncbi:nickel/cobalt transporter [Providencia vermicola]|uniref:Nickel/cobalt efflux system n=1 Tax=Providencia vermicola TaxID=333965 RepID=A0AAX3RXC2_9GAMM|nr:MULTISPECIES: nickel/cobalt transporter [Providencia]ELX8378976.1 nickel/cobalt transporter [Providencia stuartii]EMD5258180.1 nickel/cobalt transporter [Providencia stuartii]USB36654.1 nickel/cobalt transporter [Providencia vermicola]WFC05585.1 nickel/cobalt transporter [Providencia vermicola]
MPISRLAQVLRPKIVISLLLFVTLSAVAYQIYQYWPLWLQTSVAWQRQLNLSLTELLQSTQRAPLQAGSLLVAVSFLYGFLHAVGPGHGKLIISTYIATQPTRLKQSVLLSLLASLLQGGVAIVLVSVILVVFQLSTRHLNIVSLYSEKLSYAFVILLGFLFCLKAIHQWYKTAQRRPASVWKIHTISPSKLSHGAVLKPTLSTDAVCGCGHQHVVSSSQLQTSIRTQILVVLSMGLRPCSGAILVLLFSSVIGVYLWGVLAALAMAMGTALTICLIACFVYFMRDSAMRITKTRSPPFSPYWGIAISLCAGIVFILLGVLMYQSLTLNEVSSPLLTPRIH